MAALSWNAQGWARGHEPAARDGALAARFAEFRDAVLTPRRRADQGGKRTLERSVHLGRRINSSYHRDR
jgi:hypothetical protein